jgi:DNA adenine methylase
MLAFRQSNVAFASDIMPELMSLWKAIRDAPEDVARGYGERWISRQRRGHVVYYEIRDRFNTNRDPIDFLFLSRTCVNGLIRFNRNGDFNNSLHHTRPGIAPNRLEEIIRLWSSAVKGVNFEVADYRIALQNVCAGDFVFLDPPYEATRGRYRPAAFDAVELYSELARLNKVGAKWMLTYDGEAGARKYEVGLPAELYRFSFALATGQSPFTRLMGTTLDSVVESVYLNYEPPAQILSSCPDHIHQPVQLSVDFDVGHGPPSGAIELESQD